MRSQQILEELLKIYRESESLDQFKTSNAKTEEPVEGARRVVYDMSGYAHKMAPRLAGANISAILIRPFLCWGSMHA